MNEQRTFLGCLFCGRTGMAKKYTLVSIEGESKRPEYDEVYVLVVGGLAIPWPKDYTVRQALEEWALGFVGARMREGSALCARGVGSGGGAKA